MALIDCPYCGNQISDKAETCVHCGKSLIKDSNERHCSECGAVLNKEDKVCPKCGCPVDEGNKEQNPVQAEQTVAKEQKNDKNKYIIPIIVAIVAVIVLVGIFAGRNSGSTSASSSTSSQKQEVQEKTETFEDRAVKQFCSDWEFSSVTYINGEGKTQKLDRSKFDNASMPTFNAYNDKTYHFRLTESSINDGEWSVVSEEICSGMDDTEYAYNLSTDENSPNKDNIVVMAFINTEDVDADGNAHEMSIGYTVDGEARIVYIFTK